MAARLSSKPETARRSMPRRAELPPVKEFTTTATKSGTGAHVFVPKEWLGKKVYVKLVDESKEESGSS